MNFSDALKEQLDTKVKLNFSREGSFRILLFSDIQCSRNGDPRIKEAMEKIVCDKSPDLVLWGGDNPFGAGTEEEFIELISFFSEPMEKRGIPWALTYGNHDDAMLKSASVDRAQQIMESEFPYFVSKHTDGIHGVSNYVLPVYASDGSGRIALNVFSLDTGRRISEMNGEGVLRADIRSSVRLENPVMGLDNGFDIIRFDQLKWYWDTSEMIEKANGKTPAIMLTHYCPHETVAIRDNPEATGMTGEFSESISPGPLNCGLFATVLERGDVMGIYFGHNHRNSAEGRYCGVRLGYIGSIGFDAYGFKRDFDSVKNRLRGARLLTFDEKDIENYTSEYIMASDYVVLRD
ncbi:MAG: metallophosphoesterase [Clostridia bacterium]|nr:metallophosphoesterase [Clostridia bacterium]